MNVTCPECRTTYRIDPLKVPVGGVRAQCAKCPAEFLVRVRWAEAEVSPVPSAITAPEPEVAPEPEADDPPAPETTASVADPSDVAEQAADEIVEPDTTDPSGMDAGSEAGSAEATDTFADSIADSFDATLGDSGDDEDEASLDDVDADDLSTERVEIHFEADEATVTVVDAPLEVETVPDLVDVDGYGEIAVSVDGRSYHESADVGHAALADTVELVDAVGIMETVEIAETIEIDEDGTVTEVVEIVEAMEVVTIPESESDEETEESAGDGPEGSGFSGEDDEPADEETEETRADEESSAGEWSSAAEESSEEVAAGSDEEEGHDAGEGRDSGEISSSLDTEAPADSGEAESGYTEEPSGTDDDEEVTASGADDETSTLENVDSPAGFAPVEHPRADANLELPPAPFGSADPHSRAKRLARALVSDIVVYHRDRRDRSIRAGTVRQEFREEIRKSWDEYVSHVGNQMARDTSYFRDALNELLAGGQQLF